MDEINDLETMRLRLAGALVALEGNLNEQQLLDINNNEIKNCPTIKKAIEVRKELDQFKENYGLKTKTSQENDGDSSKSDIKNINFNFGLRLQLFPSDDEIIGNLILLDNDLNIDFNEQLIKFNMMETNDGKAIKWVDKALKSPLNKFILNMYDPKGIPTFSMVLNCFVIKHEFSFNGTFATHGLELAISDMFICDE